MIRLKVMDMPRESRWHQQPVALMGGIAIFVSFMASGFLRTQPDIGIIAILAGGGLIFILGILDDRLGTHPGSKFTIQAIVGIGVICFGVVSKIFPYSWLNIFLTIFWITGITNALNLIDNMDGLSSGMAIIAAMGIFGLAIEKGESNVALLSVALAGSCVGFLRYNFKPARIFMGDCGALFAGYMIAVLAVLGGWQHSSSMFGSLLSPVLMLSVIIFDTTLVTILRVKHGKKPWHGGKDHSSHRLVHILNGKERISVLILYGIGIGACILGLIVVRLDSLSAIIITLAWGILLTLFGLRLARVKCYDDM